ncbi:cytochrome P450 [Nocardiopsis alkaliphila]|uniref:cytochrome P450 n=1 Tax=Nocardiopsis alkaliphila TaxID=225762 RepID=UPI0003468AD7|nr:cytochrome P450 [Nocardiopsis alkaliphila]
MLLSRPPYAPVEFEHLNLLDSAYYAFADPHALWATLREERPVHLCDPGDGREPFWVVTRYEDVTRVLKDHRIFSSRRGTMLCIVDLSMPDIASDDMMPDSDPPRHRRLREPLNRALTPRAIAEHESRVRDIVRSLLRPALDGEPLDMAQAALMFPMAFTGSIMGLPEENWRRMSELTTMTIAYDDPDYSIGSPQATVRQAHHELFAYFRDEVSRRSPSDPGTDLIGILRSMDLDEGPLSERQLMLNCYALLLGANVTTPHVVCTMIEMMGRHPEQFRKVRENPSLRPGCLQEVLRWSSPASHFMRYTTQEVTLRGQRISADQPVSVWLGSANRDERVFDDPFRFDVTRRPNRHVAFGVGPHYCIGAGLANLALRLFLDELLEMFDGVEQVGEVRHLASNFVAGVKNMNVRFTPRKDTDAVPTMEER